MSTHKHIDKICCLALALALVLTVVFLNASSLGIQAASTVQGYESRLFDTSRVHTIDIVMDDWEGFLEGCTDEEYVVCDLVIDNESYHNVAIRAKGNTSLTQVASYGNDRYSFKVEFDHYDSTISYHGLDKLSLNNIIQDNTYMKDYLSYQMMGYFGVDAPLCSYVYITVNGEDWGLYLAVEGVEESFLERNYGSDYGELYKPDSMSMGGGRGNGGAFNMGDWIDGRGDEASQDTNIDRQAMKGQRPGGMSPPGMDGGAMPELPEEGAFGERTESMPEGFGENGGRGGGMMGSDDVSLIYTDDDYDSYSNIFDNAKTDITDTDKDRLIDSLKQLNEGENIESVVDVDEVIRYFVVHNFVCNFDSYTGSMIHNYYLYEEDGQLSMIPWDYNLAFGGFQGGQDATFMVNYPIDTPVSGGTVDSRPMLAWIFASEEYTQLYHQYFEEFISSYFDSGYFAQMMAQTKALIAPYVEKDPTKFCTYEEFETGIETLEQFCLLRAESIRGQLDGTIPSTLDGQAEDSSALVDASELSISDMGTMNNSMGGGMGGPMEREDLGSPSGEQETQSQPAQSQEGAQTQLSQQPPQTQQAGGQLEEGMPQTQPDASQTMPTQDGTLASESGDNSTQTDGMTRPGQWAMEEGMPGEQGMLQSDQGLENGILLAASAVVLLAGLAFAWRYRKRV
ncbi:CotH kinase family protein [Pseudoflavonifractor phocaeensis]|uniref:CotH kinase family protein n=1 Tax=Pseudoflavonifractor phocaeensis TaxID=1870988 RepID=UPI0025A4A557|nr:CotH kinase family protein [Pseudoflavonifractor phocaeensis]MDM8239302.1 CotH kinase family protein [Pseudoflavonifractor phocaeensis]